MGLVVAVVGASNNPRRENQGREFSGVEHQSAVLRVVRLSRYYVADAMQIFACLIKIRDKPDPSGRV